MEPERRYTLSGLAEASAAALDALGVATPNGQVRGRPDARTIRYYSALGLIDRPAEMTGRTALYGNRHLLQVLAVKAMQARGASLADVQRRLVGAAADELRRAIGPGLPGALAAAAGPSPAGRERAFWQAPPAAAPPAAAPFAGPAPAESLARRAASAARGADVPDRALRPRHLIAVPLAAGTTVMIEQAGAADAGELPADAEAIDVEALRAAAAPLLAHLTAAGLLPGSPTHPGATA